MLLQVYFWLMLAYVVGTLLATPFLLKRPGAMADFSAAAWAEQSISYLLMGVGLLGVHGLIHAWPVLSPQFWQAFLVGLAVFAALQHRMPKTRMLRASHGGRAVVVATVVGLLLLAPMFYAVGLYAFGSPSIWPSA